MVETHGPVDEKQEIESDESTDLEYLAYEMERATMEATRRQNTLNNVLSEAEARSPGSLPQWQLSNAPRNIDVHYGSMRPTTINDWNSFMLTDEARLFQSPDGLSSSPSQAQSGSLSVNIPFNDSVSHSNTYSRSPRQSIPSPTHPRPVNIPNNMPLHPAMSLDVPAVPGQLSRSAPSHQWSLDEEQLQGHATREALPHRPSLGGGSVQRHNASPPSANPMPIHRPFIPDLSFSTSPNRSSGDVPMSPTSIRDGIPRTFSQSVPEKPHLVMVPLGKTGAGKSSLLNAMFGYEHFVASNQVKSTTSLIAERTAYWQPRLDKRTMITVADTPGFGDTGGRDEQYAPLLREYIRDLGQRLGIDVFLLVFQLNTQFDKILRVLQDFDDMMQPLYTQQSTEYWKHVVLVFTNDDYLRKDDKDTVRARKLLNDELQRLIQRTFGLASSFELPLVYVATNPHCHAEGGVCDCTAPAQYFYERMYGMWRRIQRMTIPGSSEPLSRWMPPPQQEQAEFVSLPGEDREERKRRMRKIQMQHFMQVVRRQLR